MLGYNLVKRDPALAAAMGAFKNKAGADFGGDFGDDYGDDMGLDAGGDFGLSPGDEYGDDVGAARRAKPHPVHVAKVWNAHAKGQAIKQKRAMLLNPNKGSDLKVEAYKFSISIVSTTSGTAPVLGTAAALTGTGQPDVNFRPMRVMLNVPSVALVLVNEIKVGNVSGTVGGISDGFEYSPLAVNTQMSLPMMTPSTKATFLGSWTSFVPPGFVGTSAFTLVMSFVGWATMDPGGF